MNGTELRELIEKADNAYYAEDYEKAIELYQAVIQLDSNNERALQQLTKAQLNQIARPERLPSQAIRWYRMARSYIAAKDIEPAIIMLRAAIEEAHQHHMDFAEANKLLESMQGLLAAVEYKSKAEYLIKEEKWGDALDLYNKVLMIDPSDEVAKMFRDNLQNLLKVEELINPIIDRQFDEPEYKSTLDQIDYYLKSVEKIAVLVDALRYKDLILKYDELCRNQDKSNRNGVSVENRLLAIRLALNSSTDAARLGLDQLFRLFFENMKNNIIQDALLYVTRKHSDLRNDILKRLKKSEKKTAEIKSVIDRINEISTKLLKYDVFISYSHRDDQWVEKELLTLLENHWICVCIDFRDFEPGASSLKEMERAVVESRKTILVATPDYLQSEWTEFENILTQNLDPAARQRRMIPILLKPCDLPLRLRAINYVDFTRPDRIKLEADRLLRAIKRE